MNRNRIEIKSLRIENFGCFRDETYRFSGGLNQMIGGNESGKSTIFEAILSALFGVTKKEYKDYRLTLNYTQDDIEFELIRTEELVGLHDSSGLDFEGKQLTKKLSQQFPGGRDIYQAAFCFSQAVPQLTGLPLGKILDRVTAPLFGDFDKPRVEQFLQTEINRIEYQSSGATAGTGVGATSSPAEPGELEMTADILSKFIRDKNELEENLSQLKPDLEELEKVRLAQSEMETEIGQLVEKFEGAQGYSALNQQMTNLEERLSSHVNHYSRACQLTDDLGRVEKELSRLCIPEEKEAETISIRHDELEDKAEKSKQDMDRLISKRGKANGGFWVATLVLVIVCLISILHANGTITAGLVDPLVPFTLPAVALVWGIRLVSYLFHYRAKRKATNLFRSDLSQFDFYCSEINNRFNLKAADPIRAIATATARHTALESMAANLKKTIGLLTQDSSLPHMKEITKEIEGEMGELNGQLSPFIKYASVLPRLNDIGEELTARKVRFKSLKEHLAPLLEKCAPARLLNESIEGIDREIIRLKERHNDLSRRVEILKVTRTALKSASSKLIEKIYGEFNHSASELLARLTGRVSDQLRIDELKQTIEINTEDGWVCLENAQSRSVLSIASLAIKLVAASRIGGLPMIFDQADTGMDERRFELWQSEVARFVSNHQVINLSLRPMTEAGDSHNIDLNNTPIQQSVHLLS